MANKKLKVGAASEAKLPEKKVKGEKKPKWQAKMAGKKGKPEPMAETLEVAVDTTTVEASPAPPARTNRDARSGDNYRGWGR